MLIDPLRLADGMTQWAVILLLVGVVGVPAAITYFLAGSLVGSIQALKASTEAIIAGDVNQPSMSTASVKSGVWRTVSAAWSVGSTPTS